MKKYDKNTERGISLAGFVVLLALVPVIAWSLNYIIKRDFGETAVAKNNAEQITQQLAAVIATSTTSLATSTSSSNPKVTIAVATTSPVSTKPVNTTPATPQATSTNTVTFTSSGFSPSSITVARGQSVTFVNNSGNKLWVAANPFPSSSEYPDFNEKEGMQDGDSWTFTFDQAGTWFYHNHYSPATGGKVVVSWK